MTLRTIQWLTVCVLVGYTTISTVASFAIGGVKTHPTRELFPFFTWSLFSWVPHVRHLYIVEITRLGDEVFEPPIDMQSIPQFEDQTTLAYKTIQDIGRTGGNNPDKIATFEARYLKNADIDYRIVRLSFEPLERWQTGQASASWVVAEHFAESSK